MIDCVADHSVGRRRCPFARALRRIMRPNVSVVAHVLQQKATDNHRNLHLLCACTRSPLRPPCEAFAWASREAFAVYAPGRYIREPSSNTLALRTRCILLSLVRVQYLCRMDATYQTLRAIFLWVWTEAPAVFLVHRRVTLASGSPVCDC